MLQLKRRIERIIRRIIKPSVETIIFRETHIWGPVDRLYLAENTNMVNTLFNTSSGTITVGEYSFTGHNVSIITGTHNYAEFETTRQTSVPRQGNDIVIGRGVWIGTNALLLGPCTIGDNAVIGAGAVVTPGTIIEPHCIAVGIPAKVIKKI